jgi:hypothetical protein
LGPSVLSSLKGTTTEQKEPDDLVLLAGQLSGGSDTGAAHDDDAVSLARQSREQTFSGRLIKSLPQTTQC